MALEIYIAENCWACEEAVRIVEDVAPLFPEETISLLDLANNQAPGEVFAVPTYILNGKVIYLGNPTRESLIEKLSAEQAAVKTPYL